MFFVCLMMSDVIDLPFFSLQARVVFCSTFLLRRLLPPLWRGSPSASISQTFARKYSRPLALDLLGLRVSKAPLVRTTTYKGGRWWLVGVILCFNRGWLTSWRACPLLHRSSWPRRYTPTQGAFLLWGHVYPLAGTVTRLASLLVAVVFALVFSHPRHHGKKILTELQGLLLALSITFLIGKIVLRSLG